MHDPRPILHVCTTCRAGQERSETEPVAGARLHDALLALAGPNGPVRIEPVTCLASCDRGCTAAIAAPGKWGYLLGGLAEAHAADLLAYGVAYAASRNGAVLPSARPESLRRAILGRVPALPAPNPLPITEHAE